MKSLYRRIRILMGAALTLTVHGNKQPCSNAVDAVFQEVARIEDLFTVYRPDSPLYRLNTSYQTGQPYFLNKEMISVISLALHYAKISDGAFDPSSGPAIKLWGFGAQAGISSPPLSLPFAPPSNDAIKKCRPAIDYRNVRIDREAGCITLLKEDMALNLGGIVKGYAIDRAVAVLKDHGITDALLSFGSSLYALGRPPGKAGWDIRIRHPRENKDALPSVVLVNQALATSGDYERCFYAGGKRFSHLMDPRTGAPVTGMASVSLVASSAAAADALSTAAFVLGKEKGLHFLQSQENVEAFLISESTKGQLDEHFTSSWPSASGEKNIGRRQFLAMSAVAVSMFFLPTFAKGASIRFATLDEALQRMMPDASDIQREKIHLNPEQHSAAQALTGKGFRKKDYTFFTGKKGDRIVAYAIVLNVTGKKRPITFLIGIDPAGSVIGVEVLVYRESKGSEVHYGRFMKQFFGKNKSDPLRLGDDIRPISGATLSSRAAAYAVKKALSLVSVVYSGAKIH